MKREERELTLESSAGREKKERGSIFTVRVLQRQVDERTSWTQVKAEWTRD